MNSIWKAIPDWSGYEVSSKGRIRSWKRKGPGGGELDEPIERALGVDKDGYRNVTLYDGDRSRFVAVHILVLEAFVGPCPEGYEARHLDGDSGNNDIDNLEWSTHLENEDDKWLHGTRPEGSQHYLSIGLSKSAISEIKRRCNEGETQNSVADDFGISQSLVSQIVRNASWHTRE